MVDTMRSAGLIGIAAPQIGENYKIIITEPRQTEIRPADQSDELRVYFNPQITLYSPEQILIWEGCGSVLSSQLFGPVIRPKSIIIQATDQSGKLFQLDCDGILARVIQHEYDHLSGIEFLEKISDYSQLMSRDHYISRIKPLPETISASHITHKIYTPLS